LSGTRQIAELFGKEVWFEHPATRIEWERMELGKN